MDKRTIIALLIIGGILLGFSWYNSKQEAKNAQYRATQDSIALVNERLNAQPGMQPSDFSEGIIASTEHHDNVNGDSVRRQFLGDALYEAQNGQEQVYTLENEVFKVSISNKGAKVVGVELKDYNKYSGSPVQLYAPGSADFDMSFYILKNYNNYQISTGDYYFSPNNPIAVTTSVDGGQALALRLNVDSLSYVEYVYTLRKGEYMVDFDMNFVNMANILSNQSDMVVTWTGIAPQNEKGFENENNYSTLSYKYPGDDSVDDLGISKGSKEDNVSSRVQWVAFKQQFFSSIFIAENNFANASLRYDTYEPYDGLIKKYTASLAIPFNKQTSQYKFNFYFGPNKYSVLKTYDLGMERLVPLGGWIIRWVNKYIVIPVFDFLGKYIGNFGIIILLLTIFIKLLIFPLTYKSYLSMGKMRVLKPEIDEIAARYPKPDEAMKKQQATMELYKKAGVNPMGGCLPLLIQFPILIAMFRFFPASIELRGESFLWADDLSSYDSILDLPFQIPFYGDHVSLFTLLMAVTLFVSSKINFAQQASAPQMAGMKFMMLYLMPIMFVFWFNNYSSGLSYYYLVSTLITIGQTMAFRYIVNDDKLHARMKANAAKPKKKSKWQQRYDEMMKAQQQQAQQAKKRK